MEFGAAPGGLEETPAHTRPASSSGAPHAPAQGVGKGKDLFQLPVEILVGAVEMGFRKVTQSRGRLVSAAGEGEGAGLCREV